MATLIVITDTVFKAFPIQSTELDSTQKANVPKGKSFDVLSIELKRGHYLVELPEEISPVGKFGYFFAGHIQLENTIISVPSKIVKIGKQGKNWVASVDGGSEFFVGKEVQYKENIGLNNINNDAAGQYQANNYRNQYGFWADFIVPTAKCESNGYFNCLNTYDRAFFTWGFLQYAAHVPNGDFIKFMLQLLETPLAKGYFPELFVQDGQIFKETNNGNIQLTNKDSTKKLMAYLNPTIASVEEQEVIQSAKFIHWAIYSKQQQDIQVKCGIDHFKQAMKRYSSWYPLDGVPDKVCLVIADIHHQGRAQKRDVYKAMDTNGNYDKAFSNLLEIGEEEYSGRIKTLTKEIQNLIDDGILGKRIYDISTNNFELN